MTSDTGSEPPRPPRAAAIAYRPREDAAPRVVAQGGGDAAERILRTAAEHGVPIQRDPDLLACLDTIATGDAIPPEAYAVVAGILAFLLGARNDRGESPDGAAS